MKLIDVYASPEAARVLYELLAERNPEQNISHKAMPSFDEHCAFVASKPYQAWYLIVDDTDVASAPKVVGAIYLSKAREVGLFIFKRYQAMGYGKAALRRLNALHPGRLLANVAPGNGRSHRFFSDRGFKLVQVTYELSGQ